MEVVGSQKFHIHAESGQEQSCSTPSDRTFLRDYEGKEEGKAEENELDTAAENEEDPSA